MTLPLAGLANFCFIGLKAFQQRNVVNNDYGMVFVTSNLLALVEVFVIYTIAQRGFFWPLVLTIGVSGGLGCLFAMWLHNRLFTRRG